MLPSVIEPHKQQSKDEAIMSAKNFSQEIYQKTDNGANP